MMSDMIGFQYGIDAARRSTSSSSAAQAAHKPWKRTAATGWLGWTELPYNQTEIVRQIEETAAYVREHFDTFVVLGIGGSALGPIAVQTALNHLRWNELPRPQRPEILRGRQYRSRAHGVAAGRDRREAHLLQRDHQKRQRPPKP